MSIDLTALKAGRAAARKAGQEPGIGHETADILIDAADAALDLRAVYGDVALEERALQRLFRILASIEPWDDERASHRLASLERAG